MRWWGRPRGSGGLGSHGHGVPLGLCIVQGADGAGKARNEAEDAIVHTAAQGRGSEVVACVRDLGEGGDKVLAHHPGVRVHCREKSCGAAPQRGQRRGMREIGALRRRATEVERCRSETGRRGGMGSGLEDDGRPDCVGSGVGAGRGGVRTVGVSGEHCDSEQSAEPGCSVVDWKKTRWECGAASTRTALQGVPC